MSTHPSLDPIVRIGFLHALRTARAVVSKDAEAYAEVVHVVERLGCVLKGHLADLGKYEPFIAQVAQESALANSVPIAWRPFHTPFCFQYRLVREARNDAMHQGAFARHLATNLVQLALTLEDAIVSTIEGGPLVADIMVRGPTTAELWHPVSFARQQLLSNAFSFLPVQDQDGRWHLLSDLAIAHFLSARTNERKTRLGKPIAAALQESHSPLQLGEVATCPATATLPDLIALLGSRNQPVLVFDQAQAPNSLIGIVTAFDCM